MATKIAFIGGGSYQWGPKIIVDIMLTPGLEESEIYLDDINSEAREDIRQVGTLLSERIGRGHQIISSSSKEEALDGADAVVISISTGGLEAMRGDLEIPQKYGIYQSVGDTAGPGGISRGLRNVPVFADIAGKIKKYCPDAIVINYTNPMTVLTRTLFKTEGLNAIGLCHEFFPFRNRVAELAGAKSPTELEYGLLGVNHFIWLQSVQYQGEEIMGKVKDYYAALKPRRLDGSDRPFAHNGRLQKELLALYGSLPCAGPRHIAEFLPFVLGPEPEVMERWGFYLTSIEERYQIFKDAKTWIKNIIAGKVQFEPQKSSETASDIIACFVTKRGYFRDVMNLPNRGRVAYLPDEAVIETICEMKDGKIFPLVPGEFPYGLRGFLQTHVMIQELTVEAALTGNRDLVLQALLLDPLTQLSKDKTEEMLKELISYNQEYLPQFR